MAAKGGDEDVSDVESEPESAFSVSEVSSDVQSVDSDDTKEDLDDHDRGSDDSSEDERPGRNTGTFHQLCCRSLLLPQPYA